jgi:formylmethanofuran dehydrogenase subunit B
MTVCLGCGLACDDIAVTVRDKRIVQAANACDLGIRWFGDGTVPTRARVRGADVAVPAALAEASKLLMGAQRPLVYLAAEVSTNAQREACALADVLGALLDTVTPAGMVVAVQERGRCGATLGEVRFRADIIVFCGFDPDHDYPRLRSRYLPSGRDGLQVISVDLTPLQAMMTRAAVLGHATEPLAARLLAGQYVVLFVDGEEAQRDLIEALLALTEALNATTRAALVILRAGGNRAGADSVLTWQTGYPTAIDFARGAPRYSPDDDAAARLGRREIDAALVVGAGASVPDSIRTGLAGVPTIVIGPRATETTIVTTVAIDTGVAGIHDGGAAVRTDDIPLPLRPPLSGVVSETAATVRSLTALVRRP